MAAHICHRAAWVLRLIFLVVFNTLYMFHDLLMVSDDVLVEGWGFGGAHKMTIL